MARLCACIAAEPTLFSLLDLIVRLDLPDAWLVSGAIYQSVWNQLTCQPSGTGIKDYDVIYFDDADLSYEAEDRVIRRVTDDVAGSGLAVEVRNQARVHLWYSARFGTGPVAPLRSSTESLLRYAAITHAVAVRRAGADELEVVAPFGLDDIFAMRLRPNRALDNRATYEAKAERQRGFWPSLIIEPW